MGPNAPTGFDRVAWCYDFLAGAVFGPSLKKVQEAALAGLPAGAPRVLILGGGTGWVLAEVLRSRPGAMVLYLEASPNMLARARALLSRDFPAATAQVEFRHGTQEALGSDEIFDAVITFFVLDCIAADEIGPALAQLRAALRPGGTWLLADFRPAQSGWRWVLLRMMYTFFRLTTGLQAKELPALHPALARLGMRVNKSSTFFGGAMEAAVLVDGVAA
ncbi:class I SAM-dependent methyltransferase [Hymenobacter arizonensis]|uniref:class I SAM-dependent methyltransferase n=1 Tax=Hymenobacter arizonensis TaxID=1227077 RepID=UPI0015A60C78|nr:class I SAM-dependent methyltransferase [Hymenobacter arizonensis]